VTTKPQMLALCCECGQQRMTTTVTSRTDVPGIHPGEPWGGDMLTASPEHPTAWNRCTVRRMCSNCKRRTMHAYIRTADEYADTLEQGHAIACLGHPVPDDRYFHYCAFCQPGVRRWRQETRNNR
jgi:hypothetical protein